MSNALLKDLEERINIGILNYNNKSFNNFRIAENIWFNDDIWDFNNFNISKREKFQYNLSLINNKNSGLHFLQAAVLISVLKYG